MNVPYSRYVLAPCPYIPFEFYLQQIGQRQLPVQCMPHFTLENWVHPPQPFMMYPCNPVVDGNAVPSKSGPTAMLPSYFQENSNEMSFAGRMAAANTDEGIEFTQIAARATAEDAGKYPRQRKWTNKKKYQCPSCKLSFSRTNSLAAHERIHSGEMPFKCKRCKAKFRQKGNLRRHEITHTDLKPFACDMCKCTFNRKYNRDTHMRRHNKLN